MRRFFKRAKDTMLRQEGGFTLIELLVVIGIIVALAAITIPLVTRFTGSGKDGAIAAETATVQTTMSAMMADLNLTTVDANTGATVGVKTFTGKPSATNDLSGYLKKATTTYFYCWTATGDVYAQNRAAADWEPEDAEDTAAACGAAPA